ncbi:MAG: TlpA disulfide reductase family protein [Chromatiales bacterium]|jgi:thiol-disulfide isomerase/thioredoxin
MSAPGPGVVRALLVLAFVLGLAPAATAGSLDLEIAGHEVPVEVFPAEGDRLVLWLPSEQGIPPRAGPLAERLAERGAEVWMADLHAGFFLPPGPYSLLGVPEGTVPALIREALERTDKKVYLMASGRTVPLALEGVRRWQVEDAGDGRLRGALLFHPKLYRRTPQGGEEGELLPVARATNVPVYLIQPTLSAASWRADRIVQALESGGSPVFLHRVAGVSDGFHVRPDATDAELEASRRLPQVLERALELLDEYGGAPPVAAPLPSEPGGIEPPSRTTLLSPYEGEPGAPPLSLPTLGGGTQRLADPTGRVVLVNFWATWCPPCVEEIPSLNRLYARLADEGLQILAVNVGESPEQVGRFLEDKPTAFPVLLDEDGRALRDWKVYAFPTTFAIDSQGRIRYAVYGAFDWDSDEVVRTLRGLMEGDG